MEKPPWLLATFKYQGGSQASGFPVQVYTGPLEGL